MTTRLNFTKLTLDGLPVPPPKKRQYYYDAKVRGLAVCVTSTGAKTYYLYRWVEGKPQRTRLGEYPDMSIEQARRRAEEENAEIAAGKFLSPSQRRKSQDMAFGDLFALYLQDHAKGRKLSWERDEERYRNHLREWERIAISRITRAKVRELHSRIGAEAGPYAANRVLALISVVFSKAMLDEIFDGPNPTKGVDPFPEQSRDRRLSKSEVPRFFSALEAESSVDVRDYVLLSLFTGARKSNVLAMRWSELDLDSGLWRIPRTKNGAPQLLPLLESELEILRRRHAEHGHQDWVFPGSRSGTGHMTKPEKGWKRILERAEIQDFRLHDLRRTLGSWMVDTGSSIPMIGKALNHLSQETTAVYARFSLEPVRDAREKAVIALLSAKKGRPEP